MDLSWAYFGRRRSPWSTGPFSQAWYSFQEYHESTWRKAKASDLGRHWRSIANSWQYQWRARKMPEGSQWFLIGQKKQISTFLFLGRWGSPLNSGSDPKPCRYPTSPQETLRSHSYCWIQRRQFPDHWTIFVGKGESDIVPAGTAHLECGRLVNQSWKKYVCDFGRPPKAIRIFRHQRS